MTKVKANNISASNDRIVNKLQNEIKHLRDVLNIRRKGNKQDLEAQIVALKLENQRLRESKREASNKSMMINTSEHLGIKKFGINSPDSYYGESKRYDFSTDISPK